MISSLLEEFIMPDATDSERVVFILCEWTAGTWVYFSIDRFLAGKTLTGILLAALAVLFAILGVKWPALKLKLGAKSSNVTPTIERIASNRLHRRLIYSAIVIVIVASVALRIYRHYHKTLTTEAQQSQTSATTTPPQQLIKVPQHLTGEAGADAETGDAVYLAEQKQIVQALIDPYARAHPFIQPTEAWVNQQLEHKEALRN